MDDFKYLQTRNEDGVVIATMINPPKNFMNAPMVEELHKLVDAIADDDAVRVLVLTGGVDGIFITHYDVGELSAISDAVRARPTSEAPRQSLPPRRELHALNRLTLKFRSMKQPVIAAVNGTAMGGGCELSLGCDFRLMARGGMFGLPEVRVGILPGGGGTQRMARLIGTAKALELMLLGSAVDADTAERLGLVHRAVAPERLMDETMVLARELASRPPLSIALIKQCVLRGIEMPLEEGLHFEQEAFGQTIRTEDANRLMRAYLQSDRPLNEQ